MACKLETVHPMRGGVLREKTIKLVRDVGSEAGSYERLIDFVHHSRLETNKEEREGM